jgi:hypothetical protein
MTNRPCLRAIAMISSILAGRPNRCTGITPLVRGVIAASKAAGSRLKVPSSMSANTGFAPT